MFSCIIHYYDVSVLGVPFSIYTYTNIHIHMQIEANFLVSGEQNSLVSERKFLLDLITPLFPERLALKIRPYLATSTTKQD